MALSIVMHGRNAAGLHQCTVGLAPGLYVGAFGDDAADALFHASGVSSQMQDVIAKNPALAAVIPPQALMALKAVNAAAWAVKHGHDIETVATQVGPVAAGVVKSLLSSFF
jgi:hypothetical protein